MLEAFKLPAEDDNSYIVELFAEGKDLYFIHQNGYPEEFYPNAIGDFTFARDGYLYSRLPETDETGWIYFLTFDANIIPSWSLSLAAAFINMEIGQSVWDGSWYNYTHFYCGKHYDTNSYSLVLDPKDFEDFALKDLGILLNFEGQEMSLSNLKVYRIKRVDSIEDILYSTDLDTQYYTLEGIKTLNPQPGHLYIKVEGGKASKTIFR